MDDDFANWFSGFVDGERCFTYNASKRYTTPNFTISLRADDREILEECQRQFGGRIRQGERLRTRMPGHSPYVEWRINDIQALCGVVRHFEKYPLRAKKKHDFEIWKLIVQEKAKRHPDEGYVQRLCEALSATKKYENVIEVPGRKHIQLRIDWQDLLPA